MNINKNENIMKTFLSLSSAVVYLVATVLNVSCSGGPQGIEGMTVEYAENNMCIDTQSPKFGWRMDNDEGKRGVMQCAYQIEVTDENGHSVWNTGKVNGDVSQNVEYTGETLQPAMRYNWNVKVWDNQGEERTGESWFETSLMTSNDKDGWNGAKWIGGGDEDMVLYSHYLPVFKMNLSFQLKEEGAAKKAEFVYGANDERLMDANKNIYHIQSAINQSYVKIEFDLSSVLAGKEAILNVFRVGYHPDDKVDRPLVSFNVPRNIINKGNIHAKHTI